MSDAPIIGQKWNDYIYDIECLPNIFTCVIRHAESGMTWVYEVSERKNQSVEFLTMIRTLGQYANIRIVGYNNVGYDYPVIHGLLMMQSFMAADAYRLSKRIIDAPWNDRNKHLIREKHRVVKQVDLYKIHHFDNQARRTSLKQLEIALRMNCVVEFELDFDAPLPLEDVPKLLAYNMHDVLATYLFWVESREAMEFRDEMTAELGEDMTNQSDSSIGSKVFIKGLEDKQPGICGKPGRWRQTPRASINLGDCILPYVTFENPEFQRIHTMIANKTITKTKDVLKDFQADAFGMLWDFGTGGIHAAAMTVPKGVNKKGRTFRATNSRVVQARDVKSYYPNLSIKNGVFPEHLSILFCEIYDDLYQKRAGIPKSNPRNKALKLALNGTYGNSNSQYSPFYDPKYTMTITINGQLLLCMLAEWLAAVPTLEMIQANTDGIMYAVDAVYVPQVDSVCDRWQTLTRLTLETDDFSLFAQRDVNNYVSIMTDGSVKNKGCFEHATAMSSKAPQGGRDNWHKNQSSKIVAWAVEEFMSKGTPIEDTVFNCDDAFMFMETVKVQRSDRVMLGGYVGEYEDTIEPNEKDVEKGKPTMRSIHREGVRQQRIGRYYAAQRGLPLFKVMPPLAKMPHHDRPQAIEKGQPVAMCNDLHHFDWNNLDRNFYINKAAELVENTGFNL